MSEPKFTPGPWDIKPYVDAIDIAAEDGSLVAHLADRDIFSVGMPPDNARLIAAAPDLYAALRAFVDYYEGAGIGPCPEGQDDADDPDGFDADERYNVRRARAILAKARGEVADV